MAEELDPNVWVLDGIDQKAAREALAELTPMGRKIRFDFTKTDWHALKERQSSRPTAEITNTEDNGNLLPALRCSQDWSSFEKSCKKEVGNRSSSEVKAAWKAVESEVEDDNKRAAAEYYASFLPDSSELASKDDGFLVRLFKAICRFLKQLFTVVVRAGMAAIEVLKNPDAFYLRLRGEVTEWISRHGMSGLGELLFFLPDLFRLYVRLLVDSRVSTEVKKRLLAAIAYLVLPIDLIPELLIGPAGYIEDTYFLVRAFLDLTDSNAIAEGLLREHWSGKPESLERLMAITEWVNKNLPSLADLWELLVVHTRRA